MRKFLFAFLSLLFAPFAYGQHTVTLNWTISTADTTATCAAAGSCQQTVYRAPGACSATSSFISLAVIAATATTYTDTAVPNGDWCYGVTFTDPGGESDKDTASVSLRPPRPPAPTGIKIQAT